MPLQLANAQLSRRTRAKKGGRLTAAAVAAILWLLLIDAPGQISLGNISLSGILTIATPVVLIFSILAYRAVPHLGIGIDVRSTRGRNFAASKTRNSTSWALPLFTIFLTLCLLWLAAAPTFDAIQNVSVYVAFSLAIIVGRLCRTPATIPRILKAMRIAGLLTSVIFIVTDLAGHPFFGIRSIGLSALIALSVMIPDRSKSVLTRMSPFIVLIALTMSLSRTALLIGICQLIFLVVRGLKKWRALKVILSAALAGLFMFVLFSVYTPLQDRFLGGDGGVVVSGIKLNTSGRTVLWELTWNSAIQHPWIGQGPGSASLLISGIYPNIAHPHNDYLRLFHDFGLLGAVIFVLGLSAALYATFRRALILDEEIHWTAVMALLAVMISAITDNVIVYIFVMVPVGYVVGLSLSRPLPRPNSDTLPPSSGAWNRRRNLGKTS